MGGIMKNKKKGKKLAPPKKLKKTTVLDSPTPDQALWTAIRNR
jgi:hypothetical protein